jgi:hypothetical protein
MLPPAGASCTFWSPVQVSEPGRLGLSGLTRVVLGRGPGQLLGVELAWFCAWRGTISGSEFTPRWSENSTGADTPGQRRLAAPLGYGRRLHAAGEGQRASTMAYVPLWSELCEVIPVRLEGRGAITTSMAIHSAHRFSSTRQVAPQLPLLQYGHALQIRAGWQFAQTTDPNLDDLGSPTSTASKHRKKDIDIGVAEYPIGSSDW